MKLLQRKKDWHTCTAWLKRTTKKGVLDMRKTGLAEALAFIFIGFAAGYFFTAFFVARSWGYLP